MVRDGKNMIRGLERVLHILSTGFSGRGAILTFDLLKPLAVDLGNGVVLLLETLQTACERGRDFQLLILQLVCIVMGAVLEGRFHLPDCLDYLVCFISEFSFLTAGCQ